ncbi:MAG: hypothetical protein K6G54_01400, partial [Oscillospiraceae bacterium]|nr:hypothetical protein [Oscillospiraceae bacterium]
DNVKTFYRAKVNSSEAIVRRAEASKEQQRSVLAENGVSVVPPSLEQLERVIEGETDSDTLKDELGVGVATEQPPASDETAPVPAPETNAPAPLTEEEREEQTRRSVDSAVKALYAYEVELMADLGALKQEAMDEYHALPEEEQTNDNKIRIGYSYLKRCYAMEVEADKRVKAILNGLRSELTALGADTKLADTLWQSYCEEKATAKEYYLNKYL